jgi:hypothetical protein
MVLALAMAFSSVAAQTSASYKLQESVLNGGGDPAQGSLLSSASFRVKLDSIGDGVIATALGSTSFRVDGGFVGRYPPPGEVLGDLFATKTQLVWSPEKSVGTYDVYRDTLPNFKVTFGTCLAHSLTTTSHIDTTVPSAGSGYFYLVTAENRLGEKGTKGKQSSGAERPSAAPCP